MKISVQIGRDTIIGLRKHTDAYRSGKETAVRSLLKGSAERIRTKAIANARRNGDHVEPVEVKAESRGNVQVVGVKNAAARDVEFGSGTMSARPFLKPAVKTELPALLNAISAEMKR